MTPDLYSNRPPLFQENDDYLRFREIFDLAGYTDENILKALNIKDISSLKNEDMFLLLQRTNQGRALDTLIRLFFMELPCQKDDFLQITGSIKPDTLEKAGLVRFKENNIYAAVKIIPFQGLLMAFDLPRMLETDLRESYVMGIGRSSITLANLTIRRNDSQTLDLGTGCGIQALLAAKHSRQVFALDRNPRAVQMADFNAKLNGFNHVECLEGDLFEPVKNRKFDLIVTNPPFVISPENRYIYRDSGMAGDEISRKIAQEAPDFLNTGGFCQILCNWAEPEGQEWQERLKQWFAGSGCDVWVMRSETHDAATYASTWIQHTEKMDKGRYSEQFKQWMDYYRAQNIQNIGAGIIIMRKSGGHKNWFYADESPEKMLGPCGHSIEQGFVLRDFLETNKDDAALLNSCLKISPDACLERHSIPSVQGWADKSFRLYLNKGLPYSGNIDPFVANMVVKCNGEIKLGNLLNQMAASLEKTPDEIAPAFCNIVRGLVERGFLLPGRKNHP